MAGAAAPAPRFAAPPSRLRCGSTALPSAPINNPVQLWEYWGYCGEIESLDMMTFPDTGRFRGIVFITFKTVRLGCAVACDGLQLGRLLGFAGGSAAWAIGHGWHVSCTAPQQQPLP